MLCNGLVTVRIHLYSWMVISAMSGLAGNRIPISSSGMIRAPVGI